MRAWFTNLTAALLFIHAVLGCCWHHAHECNRRGAGHCGAPGATGFAQIAPEQLGCDDGDHGQPADPCRCKLECQGVCVYVAPQKSSLDAGVTGTDFHLCASAANPVAARLGKATACSDSCRSPIAGAPLRPHLLYQVLVI